MPRNTYKNLKYIVGIDEAGRGPLAGPVAVGAFCILTKMSRTALDRKVWQGQSLTLAKMFKGARDSKKMSAKKREEIFKKIKLSQKNNFLRYIVRKNNHKVIDGKGINWAIKDCIKKCLNKLEVNPKQTLVLLDGGIKAPGEFIYQKTIIGGDDKEIVISLASICAKVTRDAYMIKMAKKYPLYGFEKHKGYGTKIHRRVIVKYGLSDIHRKSFCKNFC